MRDLASGLPLARRTGACEAGGVTRRSAAPPQIALRRNSAASTAAHVRPITRGLAELVMAFCCAIEPARSLLFSGHDPVPDGTDDFGVPSAPARLWS